MSRKGSGSYSLKNKWTKTKWMQSEPKLKPYVPDTKPFTKSSLVKMINRYGMVYFKPTTGTGGNGIARIVRASSKTFRFKINARAVAANSMEDLFRKLKKTARGRSYILQKGVYLKTIRGRPFDLRTTVQKTKQGKWVPTAMFVKLGMKNKVVTNYHQGGKLALVEPTLRRAGYNTAEIQRYIQRFKILGLETARCFDRHNRRFKELGLDLALDRNGRLWILEVNTRPNYYALKSLPDKSLYRTIVRYGRAYGRTK
jgi:glutathione synthase/RimK-type ligase-like ATP-grasp enzyme